MAFRAISFIFFLLMCTPVWAATWYVRPDGGNSTQCDGHTNAAQAGATDGADSDTVPDCAMNHPAWVLPPRLQSTARAAAAGDTIIIVSGTYRTGCQNATTCADSNINFVRNGWCNELQSYDCYLGVVPNNALLTGCALTGCPTPSSKPIIWGAGRVNRILDLTNSIGVTVRDIEITDHENCMFGNQAGRDCGAGNQPTRLNALYGIVAHGASGATLDGVNVHGVGADSLWAANTNNFTIIDSNLDYGYSGWNGDLTGICTTCGQTGTITITGTSMSHNACIEDWQNPGNIIAQGCASQQQGHGNGDGLSMANTAGTWVITDSDFSYNTADGIDLLYHNRGIYSGGTITIRRSRAEGNGGNPIKTSNAVFAEDTTAIANCGYFFGQPFRQTTGLPFDNDCRAFGHAVSVEFHSGDTSVPKFYNMTVAGNGDGLFLASGVCTTGNNFQVKNSVLVGGADFHEDNTVPGHSGGRDDFVVPFYDLVNDGGSCNVTYVVSDNICAGTFTPTTSGDIFPCSGVNTISTYSGLNAVGPITQGPYNTNGYRTTKNYINSFYLTATSPAIGVSDETLVGADAVDNNNFARGASWDAGALEFGSVNTNDECGDGVRGADEDCEGLDLNGYVCSTVPGGTFTGGTLTCTAGCAFDTSACTGSSTPVCGNSTIESGETCDDGNTTNGDCCSSTCQTETSGLENLSDTGRYTESDPQSHIAVSTYTATVTNMDRNSNTSLVYDGGASHFTNFTHTFRVDLTSCAAPDGTCLGGVWAISSGTNTSLATMQDGTPDGINLSVYQSSSGSGSTYHWFFEDNVNGGDVDYIDTAPPSTRYVEIARTGTTITATLFSDSNFTTPLGGAGNPMTITGIPSSAYRYFYPVISMNDGNTDAQWNYTVRDISIGESVISCGGSPATSGTGNVTMTGRSECNGRTSIP